MCLDLLNGSGCKDPTAFVAIKNIENERRRNDMGWFSDGDVVKYDGGFGDACAVILKCHGKYCTVLKLVDRVPDENVIEVIGKQKCWADAGKTIWLSNVKIQSLERTLSDTEFEAVKEAVGKALGLWIETGGAKEEKTAVQDAGEPKAYIEEMRDQVIDKMHSLVSSVEERVRLQAERDIYKALYQEERTRN